jgi:hypothetical protein
MRAMHLRALTLPLSLLGITACGGDDGGAASSSTPVEFARALGDSICAANQTLLDCAGGAELCDSDLMEDADSFDASNCRVFWAGVAMDSFEQDGVTDSTWAGHRDQATLCLEAWGDVTCDDVAVRDPGSDWECTDLSDSQLEAGIEACRFALTILEDDQGGGH